MCKFHAKASEFLARRRRLFVGSPRTGAWSAPEDYK